MVSPTWPRWLSILLFVFSTPSVHAAEPIRVMSFNVRYANPGDGANQWEARRELVVATIEAFNPDILGLQEPLPHQMEALETALSGHALVGCGRDDGERRGEFTALLICKSRFEIVSHGRFWFSDTPEVAGSKGWGANLPRLCAWSHLRDKHNAGRELVVYNTHFDHQSRESRRKSAQAIARHMTEAHKDLPTLVLGDFNAPLSSDAMQALVNNQTGLTDTFDARSATTGVGTFHGFQGGTNGAKIDFVLATPHWKVHEAKIDHTTRDERYPSDHYPVTAVVALADADRTSGTQARE